MGSTSEQKADGSIAFVSFEAAGHCAPCCCVSQASVFAVGLCANCGADLCVKKEKFEYEIYMQQVTVNSAQSPVFHLLGAGNTVLTQTNKTTVGDQTSSTSFQKSVISSNSSADFAGKGMVSVTSETTSFSSVSSSAEQPRTTSKGNVDWAFFFSHVRCV